MVDIKDKAQDGPQVTPDNALDVLLEATALHNEWNHRDKGDGDPIKPEEYDQWLKDERRAWDMLRAIVDITTDPGRVMFLGRDLAQIESTIKRIEGLMGDDLPLADKIKVTVAQVRAAQDNIKKAKADNDPIIKAGKDRLMIWLAEAGNYEDSLGHARIGTAVPPKPKYDANGIDAVSNDLLLAKKRIAVAVDMLADVPEQLDAEIGEVVSQAMRLLRTEIECLDNNLLLMAEARKMDNGRVANVQVK